MLNEKEESDITSLEKFRTLKGIQQKTLAQNARVALRTYQYYESGERTPDVKVAQRLAVALGVGINELYPPESAEKETA